MVGNEIRHHARVVKVLGELPPIRGNMAQLGQVFSNLLINAAQAIPEGDAPNHEIRIVSEVREGAIVITISDTGEGIAPEGLARIFEPFFTTKPLGKGTGLGLSISRQAIAEHHGHIECTSEVGKGSTFRVTLPIDDDIRPEPPLLPERTATARGCVLVIDDEPLIGGVIKATLSGVHEVIAVQRASEAIELLAQGQKVDVILCDLMMPDMGGPELYETMAARWPELVERMVFMTGGAFTSGTVEFVARVAPRIIAKPFTHDELLGMIDERMKSRSAD